MTITNSQAINQRDILFASTHAFNFAGIFANRFESKKVLGNQITSPGSNVLITDKLGSGKTFFMEAVIGELALEKITLWKFGQFPADDADLSDREVVFIDECDIKLPVRRWRTAFERLAEWRAKLDCCFVFIGDYTLRSAAVLEKFAGPRPSMVPMENLDQDFLRLALKNRFSVAFGEHFRAFELDNPSLLPDEMVDIMEPEVWQALLPAWDGSTNVFRDVFRFLHQIASMLPADSQPMRVGQDLVSQWLAHNRISFESEMQKRLFDKLAQECASGYQGEPIESADLARLINADISAMDTFQQEVLEPLARQGLLISQGTPSINWDNLSYDRYPGPYSPGAMLRFSALRAT